MLRTITVLSIAIFILSCGGQEQQRINYEERADTTATAEIKDTTKVVVAELPAKFDSTDVLLFPIGLVDLQERKGYSKLGFDSYKGSPDVSYSYLNGDNLSGNFINIIFQDRAGHERKLTDRKLRITNVIFLRDIYNNTKTGYLFYSVYDRDSNGDGELDQSDIETLYISKADGSGFKKLTKELHKLYNWNLIKDRNRIYFRTQEDRDKDGALTSKDKFYYYFIDFSSDQYVVTEYNPLKMFE